MKKIMIFLALLITSFTLAACSRDNTLVIWVGAEVQDFYAEKMEEYVAQYEAEHGEAFPYEISVRAADTGAAAATFLDDMDAGPDILTVAHDNLGRLVTGSIAIQPIQDQALLNQINEQNPDTFLDVIKATVDGTEYTFGIPYEAQSLILFYNKAFLTEEDVQTWEGIWDVAKANNKRALGLTGTDGFNNSFLTLAVNTENGERVTRLYEDGVLENTEAVTDGFMSVIKWGQSFFSDTNGAREASDSGWEVDMQNDATLSVIGGAWHYNAARAALGDDLGIAVLPTFTITEDHAYGDFEAGTVMQSGTFADTKMFVMNRSSSKVEYLEDILLFLTHKDVQEASYEANNTLPAYKNASAEFTAMQTDPLAIAQIEMFGNGLPQPFGFDARYNVYYYQRQAPEILYSMLRNTSGDYDTDAAILEELQRIERIWLGIRD